MLKVKCFVCNPVAENTYVVWDDESLECAIIDAGCCSKEEKRRLQEYIEQEQKLPVHTYLFSILTKTIKEII